MENVFLLFADSKLKLKKFTSPVVCYITGRNAAVVLNKWFLTIPKIPVNHVVILKKKKNCKLLNFFQETSTKLSFRERPLRGYLNLLKQNKKQCAFRSY
jgi:hypothetical protein